MYARVQPVKGCGHWQGMHFYTDKCWCEKCGQTWMWTMRGWKPVDLAVASHGEGTNGDYW